jgi:hypothetical protein
MAKKKKKRKVKLRRVSPKSYVICFDEKDERCHFGHQSGIGGEIGSGKSDVIEVFTKDGRYYVCSINYKEPYVVIESFADAKGVESILFAEPTDLHKTFGEETSQISPKEFAERLVAQM